MKTARVVEELIATGSATPIDNDMPPENPTGYKLEAALDQQLATPAKVKRRRKPL